MGVRVTEAAADRVVAEMPVRADLCTAGGILHGGATMAFADTLGAVGTILNLAAGKRTTTTDSSTKFIAGGAQVGANRHLGDHPVGRCFGDAHAHEAREQRLEQLLQGGEIEHGVQPQASGFATRWRAASTQSTVSTVLLRAKTVSRWITWL